MNPYTFYRGYSLVKDNFGYKILKDGKYVARKKTIALAKEWIKTKI